MKVTKLFAATALSVCVASAAFGAQINEIRIDQPSSDNDEYVELAGMPGESLDGLTYLVIGDTGSTQRCGIIENVTDLTGLSIQADGLLAIGDAATSGMGVPFTYDVELNLNFENSDNVTHLLVSGFTGAEGDKLDTNDDGVLDIEPWGSVLDQVGLVEASVIDCDGDSSTTEHAYGPTIVGPDGDFVPGHVYRCGSDWLIGGFGVPGDDTPGDDNPCPVPVESTTWGSVKAIYR